MTELDFPRPDGTSLRQHLEQVEKMTGKKPAKLDGKPIPYECQRVFELFRKLSMTRAGNRPISFQDMQAYSMLANHPFSKLELETIQRFDTTMLNMKYALTIQQQRLALDKK